MVETAIIIPLAVFIIAGILDLGYIFQRSTIIYQASRAGARTGVAQTSRMQSDSRAEWCSNSGIYVDKTLRCSDVLEEDSLWENDPAWPTSPPGVALPLQSSMFMACYYLREAGLDPLDWEAAVTGPITQSEGISRKVEMRWIQVTVQRSAIAERCLFCLQQQIEAITLKETSFFPVPCAAT